MLITVETPSGQKQAFDDDVSRVYESRHADRRVTVIRFKDGGEVMTTLPMDHVIQLVNAKS